MDSKEYAVFKNSENGIYSVVSVDRFGRIPTWRDNNFARKVTLQHAIRLKQRTEKVFAASGSEFAYRRLSYWTRIIALINLYEEDHE